MYVLALIAMLASGDTVLGIQTKDDKIRFYATKAECQVESNRQFDVRVKEDPSQPFALSCVTPEQFKAMADAMRERAKNTLKT